MVAAVLAILAGLATGFYTMMLSQTRSATRYSDAVRSDMMARAGIDFAIAQLRDQSFKKTEDPTDPWYMFDYLRGNSKFVSYPESELLHNAIDDDKDGVIDNLEEAKLDIAKMKGYSRALSNSANAREGDSDRFTLNVHDAASRINVNACDNLGAVLDSLCRVIGPPLVCAEESRVIPRVWEWYGGTQYNSDAKDWPKGGAAGGPVDSVDVDIYYELIKTENRPITRPDGIAMYGDGYAIAGYRARHGRFETLQDIKNALTYVERENDGKPDNPLEQLEREVKFAAIRDFITVDSWVDTTTSCVGKFEWVATHKDSASGIFDLAVDRDKSWIPDDPKGDPENKRGSLRGCYLAIINGHGAGQLRRIKTNGIDWIQIENFDAVRNGAPMAMGFAVPPGPTSSYVIIALEDSKLICQLGDSLPSKDFNYYTNPPQRNMMTFPDTDDVGNFIDDPLIDYYSKPLCIHRAPVNVNTASDKVLAALLMGMNVTHGHFMSLGTDVDMRKLASSPLKPRAAWTGADPDWKIADHTTRKVEPYVITPKGLKRIPADSGVNAYDLDFDTYIKSVLPTEYSMNYLNNYGRIDPKGTTNISEVQELVFRILVARQPDVQYPYQDPVTGRPTAAGGTNYKRGPFVGWDDFYFRVIRPWDDGRIDPDSPRYDPKRGSVARMIMAAFNPNMDILKFNPNIEWIDRWGRNFTEMEPVMSYTNSQEANVDGSLGHGAIDSRQANINDFTVADQDGKLNNDAVPVFSRERTPWTEGGGSLFSMGPYGTDPKYMGSYVTRSFRYKSDEMLDKTDLNRSSTEFSFDSRGIYEITSTGQVARRGEVMAERKLQALVKVYDVWSESTQRDFVKGYISRAADNPAGKSSGTAYSGSIGRDSTNQRERLALSTLPEPLVPLKSTIENPKNIELVDTSLAGKTNVKRNAWGQEVPMNVPDVVANRVLPAGYDGQIALATNTQAYRPEENGDHDTFLATFDGDLDTEYSKGNGREQGKTPLNGSVRVLDTCGLLGLLNDPWIDSDPGLRGDSSSAVPVVEDLPPYSGKPLEIYRFKVTLNALRGLHPSFYWNNVTCRQGDMRTDGVWVGGPGISGNDGVMKYLCGNDDPGKYDEQNLNLNGKNASRLNSPDGGSSGDMTGLLISMWAKTSWHHNDNRNHEFFDCTTPGWADGGIRAKAFWIRKQGIVQFSASESGGSPITIGGIRAAQEDATWGISGTANRVNDLMIAGEYDQDNGDRRDPDYCVYLHGGESGVPYFVDASQRNDYTGPIETSAYFVQPFRWQFVGGRINLPRSISSAKHEVVVQNVNGAGKSGVWRSNNNQNDSRWMAANVHRPFVDSERFPEGKTYSSQNKYWGVTQLQGSSGFTSFQNRGRTGDVAAHGNGGQPVRYKWASPGGDQTADGKKIYDHVVFGLNNCNPGRGYGSGAGTQFNSIYRAAPEEGTYAVIDEYKISRYEALLGKDSQPTKDRISRSADGEMTLSRYYLPQNPSVREQCPSFTSQTMLQSLRGSDKKTQKEPDYVTLARVNWTAFTPRFMHADKEPNRFKMPQRILNGNTQVAYRGPFNYRYYNSLSNDLADLGQPREYDEFVYNTDGGVVPYRCARPTPAQYQGPINPRAAEYLGEKDYHATRGVEIELLEASSDSDMSGAPLGKNSPYTNPNKINQVRDGSGNPIKVRADRLRYRVRFRYPIDQMVDPAGGKWVDPQTQYLVDTPVFDDISITYFTKPRILDYKDLME